MCRFILDVNRRVRHDDRRSSSTTWAWSWTSPIAWWCSTTAARSPTARRAQVRSDQAVLDAYLGVAHEWCQGASTAMLDSCTRWRSRRSPTWRVAPAFLIEVLIGGICGRSHVLAGGARLRADLQGVGSLQLRAGRDGAVRRAHPGRPAGARRARHRRARADDRRHGGAGVRDRAASCCVRSSTRRTSSCSWRRSASTSSSRASARCCGAPTSRSSTSGIPDRSFIVRGVQINQLELTRGDHRRRRWSPSSPCSSSGPSIGRALRAVADDHEAALSHRHPAQDDLDRGVVGGRVSWRWSPG